MRPKEFLERVVCPQCKSKIENKVPFNSGLTCNCRQSKHMIMTPSYNNPGDDKNHLFKLYLNKDMMIVVQTYGNENIRPHFYIAKEDRPFFPLFEQHEIPDYIFMPLDELISKLELLVTFS